MGFLFKSLFWVGIVFLFLPRDPSAIEAPAAAAKASAEAVIDAANVGANFCNKQPEICESALKTGLASRDIFASAASIVTDQFSQQEPSTQTNH